MNQKLTRRSTLGLLAAALAPTFARSQDSTPIEWIVGFPPGGSADSVVRFLAEPLSRALARPVVVVNKPGASTQIAVDYVTAARGGSILFTADFATLATNSSLYPVLRYDPDKDFVILAMQARSPMMLLAGANTPVSNMKELAEWSKTMSQGVAYGSAGIATPHHLAGEYLKARTGIKLTHIPYKGGAPAVQDVLGGQIPLCIADLPTALQHVQSGKIKALGIATTKRASLLPNTPTFIEQGVEDFEVYAWQAVVVPSRMPAQQRKLIQDKLVDVLGSPPVKARYESVGLELMPGTSEQYAAFIRSEQARWGKVIRDNHIKLE